LITSLTVEAASVEACKNEVLMVSGSAEPVARKLELPVARAFVTEEKVARTELSRD
jgi:hypothetical protein